jgi:hypothetical protein
MRTDVHFAALRAAAKVAFSMALLNGCSSPDGVLGSTDKPEGDGEESSASNESAITSAVKDCPNQPAPSCAAVLASTFPKPGDYQWKPVAHPSNVVACCDKELTQNGSQSNYRWDCCVAFDAKDPDSVPLRQGEHAMACTPWGPPVPPSMDRNRDRLARRRELRARAAHAAMMAVA